MTARLHPLKPAQAEAATPEIHAWVAASAGTGKTQVLSARVLRLLLQGSPPERILCLTFTKLAAAEMQTRIFDRLAAWVRCTDAELAHDLAALRADTDPVTIAVARRLFAQVLDAPGGLAVQTIHAFAQSLIASFPLEADVAPGFATLDDRSALTLRRRLLAEAIEAATAAHDEDFLGDLAEISIGGGENRLGGAVATLLAHDTALLALAANIDPALHRAFGLPTDGDAATALAKGLAAIPDAELHRLADGLAGDGGAQAGAAAFKLKLWLALPAPARAAEFAALCAVFLTVAGEPRKKLVPVKALKADPDLADIAQGTAEFVISLRAEQALYAAAAHAARYLRVGRRLARAWGAAKARLGVVDYDDMIAATVRLLAAPGAAEWVRYKLDQSIDHLLVDEAQDTNPAQWSIVEKLTEEFWAGEGARDGQRTLFVVGDHKQSIFSFQGSNPDYYRDQRDVFEQFAADARKDWRNIGLETNFRSVGAVLDVVNATVAGLGEAYGTDPVPVHVPERDGAGAVVLWPPVGTPDDGDGEDDDDPADDGDDDADISIGTRQREMAHATARAIAGWLDPRDPLILAARGRAVRAEDILVLVRNRSGFSAALVAALHDFGVAVAGVDRLKLTQPLAVQDLLALVRFALQPDDDLTLAALMVSPLVGLSQDDLFGLAHDREATLWQRLRDAPAFAAAKAWLDGVLNLADFTAPYEFFETVLSGAQFGGRSRLLARLGEEARDAIDAVLAQALAFEVTNAPSLQGFLAWVEAGDVELKRDPEAPVDAVRLMTVHAAKGLQAPVVILADATRARRKEHDRPVRIGLDGGDPVPLFLPTRKLGGPLAAQIAADDAAAVREHWRLMYVALTRAEDLLFVGGAVSGAKGLVPGDSWYAQVRAALDPLGAVATERDGWRGASLAYATGVAAVADAELRPADVAVPLLVPEWAKTAAPQESRPPRPLSPSAIAADDVAQPPAGPAAQAAAQRGQALHTLFERLPGIAPERRRAAALAWAAACAPELDGGGLADTVIGILDDPRFAAVFADGALAEAPIAALVGDTVIAGTVDRLLVTDDAVTVVDFKTGRRVPGDANGVDRYHLKQMAAYVAALERIFPDRPVRAALLYTEGPALIDLPPDLLATLAAPLIAGNGLPISAV